MLVQIEVSRSVAGMEARRVVRWGSAGQRSELIEALAHELGRGAGQCGSTCGCAASGLMELAAVMWIDSMLDLEAVLSGPDGVEVGVPHSDVVVTLRGVGRRSRGRHAR